MDDSSTFGFVSPWHPKYKHQAQCDFLMYLIRKPMPRYERIIAHFVGGRGGGKSAALMLALLESAINVNPGLAHLWTSPTLGGCYETLVEQFNLCCPPDLFRINKGERRIYIRNNTSKETPVDYRGRDVYNSNKEPFRGPNYAAAFIDEPGVDRSDKAWRLLFAAVRERHAKRLIIATASTPKLNWYHKLVTGGEKEGRSKAFYATSYDNPHQEDSLVTQYLQELDSKFARQEVWAEWVSQSDTIWDNVDLEHDWPIGNLHRHEYDPDEPYTLLVDLGRRSAWLITQRVRGVDVAVAEITPNTGDTDSVAALINKDFGEPSHVIVGHDVETPNIVDGDTSMTIFRSLGWRCPINWPTGIYARKQIQYQAAKRALCNATGDRLFAVSRNLISYEPNDRGIKEVFLQDTWESGSARIGEFLPKDKLGSGPGLEDMRDAWMYGMVMLHPIRGFKDEIATGRALGLGEVRAKNARLV